MEQTERGGSGCSGLEDISKYKYPEKIPASVIYRYPADVAGNDPAPYLEVALTSRPRVADT